MYPNGWYPNGLLGIQMDGYPNGLYKWIIQMSTWTIGIQMDEHPNGLWVSKWMGIQMDYPNRWSKWFIDYPNGLYKWITRYPQPTTHNIDHLNGLLGIHPTVSQLLPSSPPPLLFSSSLLPSS
jgi:hypothetical protein